MLRSLVLVAALAVGRVAAETPTPTTDETPPPARAQTPADKASGARPATSARPPAPGGPRPVRVRLVLNGIHAPSGPSYSDARSIPEYAETTTIRSRYEAGSAFGPDGSVQVTVFRGLGVLVGYSALERDVTGSVDVSRPHPLYLNQPRTATATLTGYGAKETSFHFDLAWAGGKGHLDWSIFAGVTRFQVEADLLDVPTYDEAYPYDELTIASTPAQAVESSATGFDVGGRLDYRFGASGRFGAGVQLRYSAAAVELKAPTATSPASYDAGGLAIGAGVRVYF